MSCRPAPYPAPPLLRHVNLIKRALSSARVLSPPFSFLPFSFLLTQAAHVHARPGTQSTGINISGTSDVSARQPSDTNSPVITQDKGEEMASLTGPNGLEDESRDRNHRRLSPSQGINHTIVPAKANKFKKKKKKKH